MSNKNIDPIVSQIVSKLEKANLTLTQKHLEMTETEEEVLRLERAQAALNNEITLPLRNSRTNKSGITKNILEYVNSNPGLRGSDIRKGLNTVDSIVYTTLSYLTKQGRIEKSLDKRYYPVKENADPPKTIEIV